MPNINAGPAVSAFVNEVPLRGTFDTNGKLLQILGSGQNVAFDPANVAITGGSITGVPLSNPALGNATGISLALTDNSSVQANVTVTNTGANGAALKLVGNGGVTPGKVIRVNSGVLQVINDAYSAVITQITDTGRVFLGAVADDGFSVLQVGGNVCAKLIGSGLRVLEGANGKQGAATLAAGTVTVNTNNVTANSRIILTGQSDGGTPGFLRVSSRVVGASFTITSSSATDTSVVAYQIFEPA